MATMSGLECSVVVPVFNGEKTLVELFTRLKRTFESLEKSFEVIFVEDSSTDNSWTEICAIKNRYPDHVTAIRLARNFGQHNALLCGLHHVRGHFVITLDDDLQNPPEEIPKLFKKQAEVKVDLVYGIYKIKQHDALRNIGSYIVQRIFRYVFRTDGNITSFRLITYDLVAKLLMHRQSFVFLDGLLHWYTDYISFVEVDHEPRRYGKSGYSITKLLRLANNLLFNFTTIPLRMIIYLGFLTSFFSFLIGVAFIIRRLRYDVPLGFTAIIVSMFFMGGITLLVIGVIGEYLSRLYSLQNDKPQYSIKQML